MAQTKAIKALDAIFKNGMQSAAQSEEGMLFVSRNLLPLLGRPLVQQMGIGSTPVAMLDSACGTGVATDQAQALLREGGALDGSSFLAADSSEMLTGIVRKRVEEEGWVNTETRVLDAMDTRLPAESFSHVAIALALHLTPRPDDVVKDTIRILRPGGVIGFTTFQEGSAHEFWRADLKTAFASFPFEAPFPDKLPMQMHSSGNWADRQAVESHLGTVYADTLTDVEVKNVVGRYTLNGPEEWVVAFGSMLTWITSAFWSEETRAAHPVEEVQGLILEHLREKHGGKPWEVSWELVVATARRTD